MVGHRFAIITNHFYPINAALISTHYSSHNVIQRVKAYAVFLFAANHLTDNF
jgi:hypothetical protein